MHRVVFLSMLTIALIARADGLSEAAALLADARFEGARQRAASLLDTGRAREPRETAELHFIIARASAALGDVGQAELSFGRAMELAPGLQLPVGTSPKLIAPYEAARRVLGGRSLTIAPAGRRIGNRGVVRVKIVGDVFQLFSQGTVRRGAEATVLAPTDPPQATLSCPISKPCTYRISLRDLSGNPLLEAGTEASPLLLADDDGALPLATPTPSLDATRSQRPFFARPLPWFLLCAAAAVGAGVMWWQTATSDARVRSMVASPGDSTYGATVGQAATRDALLVGAISASVVSGGALLVGVFVW